MNESWKSSSIIRKQGGATWPYGCESGKTSHYGYIDKFSSMGTASLLAHKWILLLYVFFFFFFFLPIWIQWIKREAWVWMVLADE